jgi:hypothetical protein
VAFTQEQEMNEASLPKWAQERLERFRSDLQKAREPLLKELGVLRPKVELLEARNAALVELLQAAARGGHLAAADIVRTLEGYELQLVKAD